MSFSMRLDYVQFARQLSDANAARCCESSALPAAVMMLFVDRPETHVLFIEKTKTQGYPWSGHVAFPGGRIQDQDASPLAAAFREVEEELGIAQSELLLLGPLGSYLTRRGGISLHVFAAQWTGGGELRPDRKEIAEVFEIDLDRLCGQHACLVESPGFAEPDCDIRYEVQGRTLWGVTARIVHEVLCARLPVCPVGRTELAS